MPGLPSGPSAAVHASLVAYCLPSEQARVSAVVMLYRRRKTQAVDASTAFAVPIAPSLPPGMVKTALTPSPVLSLPRWLSRVIGAATHSGAGMLKAEVSVHVPPEAAQPCGGGGGHQREGLGV